MNNVPPTDPKDTNDVPPGERESRPVVWPLPATDPKIALCLTCGNPKAASDLVRGKCPACLKLD